MAWDILILGYKYKYKYIPSISQAILGVYLY